MNSIKETIKKSYQSYLHYGSRSSRKLDIVHGDTSKILKKNLEERYFIHSKGYGDSKEYKLHNPTLQYSKDCDITIVSNEQERCIISVKFPMSNYQQNSNNYIENLAGEASLMKIIEPTIKVSHLLFLPISIPYYRKDGTIKNFYHICESDIDKYKILINNNILDNLTFILIDPHIKENKYINTHKDLYCEYLINNLNIVDKNNIDSYNFLSDKNKDFVIENNLDNLIQFIK